MPDWKKSYYAVWVAELFAIMGFATSIPMIPFFLTDLGVRDPNELKFWVALIHSVSSVALAIMAPIWGRLADSHGRRIMLLRAMIGGAVITLIQGFAVTPLQFFILRTLQAMVTGTIAAATVLVSVSVPRGELTFCMGFLQTGVFIGSSAGPMMGGLIADGFGNRMTLFATSILLVVAGLIVLGFVKEEFIPTEAPRRFTLKSLVPDFSPLMKSKELLVLLGLIGLVQLANSVVGPILPLYIKEITPDESKAASLTGIILGLSALAAAAAALVIGKISPRLGAGRTILYCTAGACLLTAPQGFVRTTGQLLALRMTNALFLGSIGPVSNALIAQKADKGKQGSIYGLAASISSFGFAIGPVIGASLAAFVGFGSVFMATSILLLAAVILIARNVSQSEGMAAAVREENQ